MLKKNCSECGSIVELDESKYTPGANVTSRCQLCGAEVVFEVPTSKTKNGGCPETKSYELEANLSKLEAPVEEIAETPTEPETPEIEDQEDKHSEPKPENTTQPQKKNSAALAIVACVIVCLFLVIYKLTGRNSADYSDSIDTEYYSESDHENMRSQLNADRILYDVSNGQKEEIIYVKDGSVVYWDFKNETITLFPTSRDAARYYIDSDKLSQQSQISATKGTEEASSINQRIQTLLANNASVQVDMVGDWCVLDKQIAVNLSTRDMVVGEFVDGGEINPLLKIGTDAGYLPGLCDRAIEMGETMYAANVVNRRGDMCYSIATLQPYGSVSTTDELILGEEHFPVSILNTSQVNYYYDRYIAYLDKQAKIIEENFITECKAKGMIGYATDYKGLILMEFYSDGKYKGGDIYGEGYFERIPDGMVFGDSRYDGSSLVYKGRLYGLGSDFAVDVERGIVEDYTGGPNKTIEDYCSSNYSYGRDVDLTFYWF